MINQADRHQAEEPVREGRADAGSPGSGRAGLFRRPGADRTRLRAARAAGRHGDGAPLQLHAAVPGGLEMTTSRTCSRPWPAAPGEEGARHPGLQRLGRRPAGGRDRPQRLAHGERRAGHHLRHAGRAALRTRSSPLLGIDPRMLSQGGARMSAARPRHAFVLDPQLSRFRFRRSASAWPPAACTRQAGRPSHDRGRGRRALRRHRPADRRMAARCAGRRGARPSRRHAARQYAPRAVSPASCTAASGCRCTRSTSATAPPRPRRRRARPRCGFGGDHPRAIPATSHENLLAAAPERRAAPARPASPGAADACWPLSGHTSTSMPKRCTPTCWWPRCAARAPWWASGRAAPGWPSGCSAT